MYSKKSIEDKILEIGTTRKIEIAENIGGRILFCIAHLTSSWIARKGISCVSIKFRTDGHQKDLDPQDLDNLNKYLKLSDGAQEGWIVEVSEDVKYCRITFPNNTSAWFETEDMHIITILPRNRPDFLTDWDFNSKGDKYENIVKKISGIINNAGLNLKETTRIKKILNNIYPQSKH